MGIFSPGRRRRDRRDDGLDHDESTGYVGPNQAVVVSFIDSLARMSKADWYRVAVVAQRAPGWEADALVRQASRSAGRDGNTSLAAVFAEQHLLNVGGEVWRDSLLAQRIRAEVTAEAEGRTATLGDVFDADGGDEIRVAGLALTGAVSALVVSDLIPLASLEPLLAPFRGTSAALPAV